MGLKLAVIEGHRSRPREDAQITIVPGVRVRTVVPAGLNEGLPAETDKSYW